MTSVWHRSNVVAGISYRAPAARAASGCLAGFLALVAIAPAAGLAQQIETQIRTADPTDDYLTWAPAPARIRQIPQAGATDKVVILTNDAEGPVPPGRKYPLDGNVAFAKSITSGATATEKTLELVLPKDGTWVNFFVAGSFPRASSADKDAVIEVHEGSATGPRIHSHAAMVRIRKNQRDLTDQERINFLTALSRFLREQRGYERFVRVHELASMGKYQDPAVYFWPDLAHRGPAFLAFHRAYLLSFERELQKIDPSVALPYWIMDELPSVFDENFMGANAVSAEAGTFVEPTFSASNPLAHWAVNGEALYRFPYQRSDAQDLKTRFFSDETLFVEGTYSKFSRKLEGNPHNLGHNWTGPWMQNCMISPSDPVFWPFHTGFDRQWAKWQWTGGRVNPNGSGESYFPNDAYDDTAAGCNVALPNGCAAIGHHLQDTMWPWNSAVGPGATIKGNRPPADLSQGYIGPFPKASIDGLWPSQPATPTPGDVIDYAGATAQRLDMGFAYDDVPFGIKLPQLATAATPATTMTSVQQTAGVASGPIDQEAVAALAVLNDRNRPEAERINALRNLTALPDSTVVPAAIGVLNEAGRSEALGAAAIEALSLQMMFGQSDHHAHHAAMGALHAALTDRDLAVRQSALRVLASHRDPALIAKLVSSLDNPADKTFTTVDAIRGLAVAGGAVKYAPSIRKHIATGDSNVRAAAIVALAPDATSRPAIEAVLADRSQPEAVRSAAIRSLAAGNSGATDPLLAVVKNAQEQPTLREQAAGALAATVEARGAALSKVQLNELATELRKVDSTKLPAVDRALKATDALSGKK
ncbi:tyrosinase family protein [Bradyrhizobium sp. USDA 10063]